MSGSSQSPVYYTEDHSFLHSRVETGTEFVTNPGGRAVRKQLVSGRNARRISDKVAALLSSLHRVIILRHGKAPRIRKF